MRRKPLAALLLPVVAALALAAAAAAGNGGIAPVEGNSPNADRTTDSYWLIMIFTGAIFLAVEAALIVFVVRFRRRGRPVEAEGPQIRGNTQLEIAWTVVPVLILAIIGAYVFYKLPGIQDVPSAEAAGERLEVQVEGRQFYWNFRYPNGALSVDELVVPVARTVVLEITAPEHDVIHSWWVPALGGKFDAIPGKTTRTWFRARRTGVFEGQCAEFCGLQHAVMRARVRVVSASEYESFLARQAAADLGRQTWEGVCQKCHGPGVAGEIGPELRGNPLLGDPEAVARIVTEGRRTMPAVGRGWSEEQLDALTGYLREEVAGGG